MKPFLKSKKFNYLGIKRGILFKRRKCGTKGRGDSSLTFYWPIAICISKKYITLYRYFKKVGGRMDQDF